MPLRSIQTNYHSPLSIPISLIFLAGMPAKAWKVFKATGCHNLHCLIPSPGFLLFSMWPGPICCFLCVAFGDIAVLDKWFDSMISEVFPNLSISMILLQAAALFCLGMVPDALDPCSALYVLWAYMKIRMGIFLINFRPGEPSEWALPTFSEWKVFLSFRLCYVQPIIADEALMRMSSGHSKENTCLAEIAALRCNKWLRVCHHAEITAARARLLWRSWPCW